MQCRNCGSDATIKAHLIPRAFAVEVKAGKSMAANVVSGENFIQTQSGVWDNKILCGPCDGMLGRYENYAHGVTKRIRACRGTHHWQQRTLDRVDTEELLRFCAGILYKFSLTTPRNGRINLGRYQEILRLFLYEPGAPCPPELDALIVRPLRFPNDNGVFAYRTPHNDRQHGLNCYRMMLGGVIFFVFLDARGSSPHRAHGSFLKRTPGAAIFTTVDARIYEEFTIPSRMVHQGRLSDYLDRIESL